MAFTSALNVLLLLAGLLTLVSGKEHNHHNHHKSHALHHHQEPVAVKQYDSLYAWGSGHEGELGVTSAKDHTLPVEVETLRGLRVMRVASGEVHSLATLDTGEVYVWGSNEYGQLCRDDVDNIYHPEKLDGLGFERITEVTTGTAHTFLMTENKEVYACGRNMYGQLGVGDDDDYHSPTKVSSMPGDVKQIVAGEAHSLLVTDTGNVYSMGGNMVGQLGVSGSADRTIPTAVGSLRGIRVTQVACGDYHSLALTWDGQVYAWGANQVGQLGIGNYDHKDEPTLVEFNGVDGPIQQITARGFFNLALTASGILYGWGGNAAGELFGLDNSRHIPTHIPMLDGTDILEVVGGQYHVLALTKGGNLFSWGSNYHGQLGNGESIDTNDAIELPLKNVQFVAAGKHTSFAVIAANEPDPCPVEGIWPETRSSRTAYIMCNPGYEGQMTRKCSPAGQWEDPSDDNCEELFCFQDGDWPATPAGRNSVMDCHEGFLGAYTRFCHWNGTWSELSEVQGGGCQAICEDGTYWDNGNCIPCHPGTYKSNEENLVTNPDFGFTEDVCRVCEPGQSQGGRGQSRCEPCPENTFSDSTGAWHCTECPPHHYTLEIGAVGCWRKDPPMLNDLFFFEGQVQCNVTAGEDEFCESLNGATVTVGRFSPKGNQSDHSVITFEWAQESRNYSVVRDMSSNLQMSAIGDLRSKPRPTCWLTTENGTDQATFPDILEFEQLWELKSEHGSFAGYDDLVVWESFFQVFDGGVPTMVNVTRMFFRGDEFSSLVGYQVYSTHGNGTKTRMSVVLTSYMSVGDVSVFEMPETCIPPVDCRYDGEWPSTLVGTYASLPCPSLFEGSVMRYCSIDGVWGDNETHCDPLYCTADSGFNTTRANQTATLDCGESYVGQQTRFCSCNGTFEEIDRRECSLASCPTEHSWPASPVGYTASIPCPILHGGVITRTCEFNGVWAFPNSSGCYDLKCPQDKTFPETLANTTINVACDEGFMGEMTRTCGMDGVWEDPSSDGCVLVMEPVHYEEGTDYGAIAGGVAGATVGIGAGAVGIWYKRKKAQEMLTSGASLTR